MKDKRQFVIAKAVVEKKGKFLLVKRNRPGHYTHGLWELPGGKVEYKESPIITAERETLEETGFVVKVDSNDCTVLSRYLTFDDHESHLILIAYKYRVMMFVGEQNDKNVMQIGWFTKEEILYDLDLLSGTWELISRLTKGDTSG